MKNFLIIALSAATVYLLYTAYKKKEEEGAKTPAAPTKEPFVCPEGEILCEKKENTCHNPAAKYIVDPCL
jgi:hypothetical protein